ncbi:hypothetical protein HDR58_00885 [bacterium]|nr:hypothetical protein [bacterium]
MSDNYFAENNKFWNFEGVIGRRNFITNYFIIQLIKSLILSTPFLYLFLTNPKIINDFSFTGTKTNNPLWWIIWILLVGVIDSILYYPSVVRRVRDIIGEPDENRVYMISSILIVLIFIGYGMNWYLPLSSSIAMLTILILMCVKGKITGSKPKNEIIKFNFGACFGTWLWGLFNKTPITLLMLPLILTTGWFQFMIICGLKGNEWAYNNNPKYSNPQDFHKSQSNQTVVWSVLMPIILLVGFILFSFGVGLTANRYIKKHPDAIKNMNKLANEYQEVAIKKNFTKIDLTDDEYKFYIEPQIWTKLPTTSKKNLLQVAANYVKDTKNIDIQKDENFEIVNKVKIYSSFNNELLGERQVNIEEIKVLAGKAKNGERTSLKKYMEIVNGSYKFNNHPSLP